jgi:hypothetical protein
MRSDPPEPKGKLDAMLTDTMVDAVTVNGPEGVLPAWDAIDWQSCEEEVRRLRRRIFKAAQEQDWPTVRNLQKLMLRSRSNTLVSVRQVTQRNAGRKIAGIDGEVALTSSARGEVAVRVHRSASSWTPLAVKRVYIPKASNRAKLRPLGIPVIMDRCHQARVRNALEPEWEARFEPRSYGFRPGRGCHTRSRRYIPSARGRAPSGYGFLTPTWRRRSTGSTTPGCCKPLDHSRPGT